MVRPTLQPPSFTCVVIIIIIIIIVIVMVIIIVIIIIIIIIIITIITVIIVISVIIVIIVLIAIMITSLSTDLFIRYNFIRFGCMDSAQHSFRQHKVHSAQQPWYGLYGAGTVYIYIYTCLLVRQLCVCLVLFCRKHRKRFWANLSYCLETISG